MNIVPHIWRDQFDPFGPIKNGPWDLRGPPKTAIFGHIWQYLVIDGPSCPTWVEHRLNRVEQCISHMEGPVRLLWTHQKWSLGSQGAPQNGHFWPYLAIFGYRRALLPHLETKQSYKMEFRHINLRAIGPPQSKNKQKQITAQFLLKFANFGGQN